MRFSRGKRCLAPARDFLTSRRFGVSVFLLRVSLEPIPNLVELSGGRGELLQRLRAFGRRRWDWPPAQIRISPQCPLLASTIPLDRSAICRGRASLLPPAVVGGDGHYLQADLELSSKMLKPVVKPRVLLGSETFMRKRM